MIDWNWWVAQFVSYFPKWTRESVCQYLFAVLLGVIICSYAASKKQFSLVQWLSLLLCIAYGLIVLFSTIVTRTPFDGSHIDLTLFNVFWRLKYFSFGFSIKQDVFNFLLLLPIGVLLPVCFRKYTWKTASIVGFIFSAFIELAQFATKRGVLEIDDLIFNIAGMIVGLHLYRAFSAIISKLIGNNDWYI